jgi:diguanylate cyclase
VIEYAPATVAVAIVLGFASFSITYLLVSETDRHARNMFAWAASMIAVISIHLGRASGTTMIPINGFGQPVWALGTAGVSIIIAIGFGALLIVSALAAVLDTAVLDVRVSENRKLALLAESILGTPREDLRGSDILKIMQLDDLGHISMCDNHDFGERPLFLPDGRKVIVEINSRAISDKASAFNVFAVRDLTQRLRNEARVRTLAYQDPLTGLANRVTFNLALSSAIHKGPGGVHDLAVLIIDMDEFKDVNDQFGHRAGDLLLTTVATRIKSSILPTDLVARLSGDEYAVILMGRSSKAEIKAMADSILSAISAPLKIEQRTLAVGASIGVSVGVPASGGLTRILTSADRALYAAKESGRGQVRFYDTQLHRELEQKRGVEHELHQALLLGQFELHYQPKVCSDTRAVLGREALIRWNHPERGLVYPDHFISIAEQSLLINEIGSWTIRAACEEARNWDEAISVSVNLSARKFLDPDLVDHVRQALTGSGIAPSRLELEVTETALIQSQSIAVSILNEFKAMGVQIALDDFGTGYSSMSSIQSFPFDRIKIDRSFVTSMNLNYKSRAIVEAIIHLAHALKIPVVVEGVETESQAMVLRVLGCEELQGYLIARPEPMDRKGDTAVNSGFGNSLNAS